MMNAIIGLLNLVVFVKEPQIIIYLLNEITTSDRLMTDSSTVPTKNFIQFAADGVRFVVLTKIYGKWSAFCAQTMINRSSDVRSVPLVQI